MSEPVTVRYALLLFQGLELQKIHEKGLSEGMYRMSKRLRSVHHDLIPQLNLIPYTHASSSQRLMSHKHLQYK